MQEPNFPDFLMPHEEPFNIKEYLVRALYHWQWFVISLVIGIAGAWFYNRYASPEYQINATVLVEDEKKSTEMNSFFEGLNIGGNVKIQNHIGMLKSYTLNFKTLENLDWGISWYEDTPFYRKDIYGTPSPYTITPTMGKTNITEVPIKITPISNESYLLSANHKKVNSDEEEEINVKFEAEGKFGTSFQNEYFAFTISKNPDSNEVDDKEYLFTFNDIEKMALKYKEKLVVDLEDKQSDLISLELKGPNKQREMDYLNELGRVYIQYGLTEKNRMSENTLRFIDSQLLGITDSLYTAENNFTTFRSEKKVVDLNQEASLVLSKLEELESEKAMVEMRIAYVNNLKNDMKDSRQMKQTVTPSVVGFTDETLNSLVDKLIELYNKREVLSFSLEEKAPILQVLDKELQMTLNALSKNVDNLLENLQIEQTTLNKRIHQFGGQLSDLPQNEQKLINLKRRFDLNNELYTFLLQKRAETAITMASSVSDVKILDPARKITTIKTGPKKLLNYLIGLLVGLFFPVLFFFAKDFFNDTLQNKEEVEKRTNLPIIGLIAHNEYGKDMVVAEHPRSSIAESFRALRTNLKYILPNENQKVIAMHSTIPGEGKTFVSLNLASALALNNKKVLLVGADMRKPRLHLLLDNDNKKGLSSYLIKLCSFDEILFETDIKNLYFTASGPVPPNPAELLENGAIVDYLDEAKRRFDYIILDNAPISMVTDGILVGSHADANIFLLRFKKSHRDQVKFIDEMSERKALPNIAVALNDARMDGYGYNDRYNSYNYGYGFGYYDDSPNLGFWRKWAQKVKRKMGS